MFWQGGGPSHVDLFDEKPLMKEMAGKDIPDTVRGKHAISLPCRAVMENGPGAGD